MNGGKLPFPPPLFPPPLLLLLFGGGEGAGGGGGGGDGAGGSEVGGGGAGAGFATAGGGDGAACLARQRFCLLESLRGFTTLASMGTGTGAATGAARRATNAWWLLRLRAWGAARPETRSATDKSANAFERVNILDLMQLLCCKSNW